MGEFRNLHPIGERILMKSVVNERYVEVKVNSRQRGRKRLRIQDASSNRKTVLNIGVSAELDEISFCRIDRIARRNRFPGPPRRA